MLIILKSPETQTEATSSSVVEFEFPEKGISVHFTVPFLYELLIDASQKAFSRLTKSSIETLTPSGK